jgi:DNA-binding XRE family transcriptional regulator
MAKKDDLRRFLMASRARIDPQTAGFKPNPRRRTRGLTREQVAQMAGVSPHWYARFESGSAANVSPSVIGAICRALKLNREESVYLFRLAGAETPEEFPRSSHPDFSVVEQVINEFVGGPSAICDSTLNVLSINRVAQLLAGTRIKAPFNLLDLLFTQPVGHAIFHNWKALAEDRLALFRAYYARHADDPEVQSFVTSLREKSHFFANAWDKGAVKIPTPAILGMQLSHPTYGTLTFDEGAFPIQDSCDYFVTFATASDVHTKGVVRKLLQDDDAHNKPKAVG